MFRVHPPARGFPPLLNALLRGRVFPAAHLATSHDQSPSPLATRTAARRHHQQQSPIPVIAPTGDCPPYRPCCCSHPASPHLVTNMCRTLIWACALQRKTPSDSHSTPTPVGPSRAGGHRGSPAPLHLYRQPPPATTTTTTSKAHSRTRVSKHPGWLPRSVHHLLSGLRPPHRGSDPGGGRKRREGAC